jgi:hypothetical protein
MLIGASRDGTADAADEAPDCDTARIPPEDQSGRGPAMKTSRNFPI